MTTCKCFRQTPVGKHQFDQDRLEFLLMWLVAPLGLSIALLALFFTILTYLS
jgi:hypothetical protein